MMLSEESYHERANPPRHAHAEDAERVPPDQRRRRHRGGRFSRRALPPPLARPSGGAAPRLAPEYRRGVPDRDRPREGDALTLALDSPAWHHAAAWSPAPSSSRNWRAASSSAVRIASPPSPFRSSTVTFAVGDRKTRDVGFFALVPPLLFRVVRA